MTGLERAEAGVEVDLAAPRIRDFDELDRAAVGVAGQVAVMVERSLPEFGAVLRLGERELASIACPRGAAGILIQARHTQM